MSTPAVSQNCAVIGKIPGYNKFIDPQGNFQNVLLRDITYIDLLPATYKLNDSIKDIFTKGAAAVNFSDLYKYGSGLGGSPDSAKTVGIFKTVLGTMAKYLKVRFDAAFDNADGYKTLYGEEESSDILVKAHDVIKKFGEHQSIRILAANDSTFTETISNTYSPKGTLDNISQSFLNKGPAALQQAAGLMQKAQAISYDKALDTLTNFSSNGSLMDVISGKLLGLQFASPNAWQESSYASTLSLFIKLASPSGDPLSILKYITIPILTLMAAGSPLTVNGLTYGMPLIWDVRAYGITRFKVGALAALTISRGSYETVFNQEKQPLIVDVRLTIVPLVQDFAVQYQKPTKSCDAIPASERKTHSDASIKEIMSLIQKNMGSAGTDALASAKSKDYIGAFTKLTETLISTMSGLVGCVSGATTRDIYQSTGLGVQSPSDEIEGLMGLGADINGKRASNFIDLPKSHLYSI